MRHLQQRRKEELGIAVRVLEERPTAAARISMHLTNEVSRDGMRFRHTVPLPPDAQLHICVALANANPPKTISHMGRVRWSARDADGKYSIGVELSSTSLLDTLYWYAHVDRPAAQG